MSKTPVQVKVVLLGDSGVGKSSIVLRFVADNFKADAEATIGASYMGKILQFNEKMIKFNIWDTAGQERYHSLAKMYYRDANAAIMVYDITKKGSFEGLKRWHKELTEFGPKDIAILIAGNKEDLVEEEATSPEEAQAFARSIGALYKKTSAKTNYGVEQIFRDLASKIFPDIETVVPARKGTVTVNKTPNPGSSGKKCC
jgi:small GTP-binding protein domain